MRGCPPPFIYLLRRSCLLWVPPLPNFSLPRTGSKTNSLILAGTGFLHTACLPSLVCYQCTDVHWYNIATLVWSAYGCIEIPFGWYCTSTHLCFCILGKLCCTEWMTILCNHVEHVFLLCFVNAYRCIGKGSRVTGGQTWQSKMLGQAAQLGIVLCTKWDVPIIVLGTYSKRHAGVCSRVGGGNEPSSG